MAVVNIKERYLNVKFSEALSPEDKAAAQAAAFFENLYPMITPVTMKQLPPEFFNLRRAARIIGRQEGFPKEDQETKGLALLMEKPIKLLDIFEIKPSKEWKNDKKHRKQTADTEPGFSLDDEQLRSSLKSFYAEYHRPPKLSDAHAHLPIGSMPWGDIKRERQEKGLSTFAKLYEKIQNEDKNAALAAKRAEVKAHCHIPHPDQPKQSAPSPTGIAQDVEEKKDEKRDLTDQEAYQAVCRHFYIKDKVPNANSAYVGLPEDSYAWSSVATKLLYRFGSIEVFVADYELNNPQEKPLPIPVKGPVIYASEVFNAVVNGLNKDGKIPLSIGKYRTIDIDESFARDRVLLVESLIRHDAEKPTSLLKFALAAGLVIEKGEEIIPAPDHRLIKWAPTQQPT